MLAKIKELREKRAKLVAQAREIINREEITAEDEAQFDKLMAEADKLKDEIDRLERLDAAEKELAERVELRAGRENITVGEAERDMKAEQEAFRAWILGGMSALTPEQMDIMTRRHTTIQAAQSVGTDTAGGYLVPEDFYDRLERAMTEFGGMRAAATVFATATGATLPMPTTDDTSNKGAIITENSQVTEQDVTFGAVNLGAYMYSSKIVRVSLQLLQDSAFNVEDLLARLLAERIARITNEHFTTGSGSGQPKGIVTASTQGVQGATGQTTSVTFEDLVDLEHSVDPAYRRGAKWMMHDSTLKVIKKLKDGDSRPLFLPGLALREPDTILGYPFIVNQDMPTMAASAKSILFGDLSKYYIRDVKGVVVLRLSERYADYLQVGFLAFSRHDGNLLDAGAHPVKHYANSAS